jgi:BirA family biotin operon repressor/biotin-[acetyl-CoA-carboxylase] ligase
MQETRRRILDALGEGRATGPELADRFGVSRSAVWKHVEQLREAGFEIDSGASGYRLVGCPEFGGLAVEYGLDAPYAVEFHRTTDSTNRRAAELAADGATDVVVLADEQTGGRGRLDRGWAAPSGGIWLSVVLRPDVPPAHAPIFTLAAAVAVTRTATVYGVDARIKWPNDVLVARESETNGNGTGSANGKGNASGNRNETGTGSENGHGSGPRKLAGVLTEMAGEADRVSWLIVGVGINANVDAAALPAEATSLRAERGDVDRREFTQRVLAEFHALSANPERVLDDWRDHADTLGRRVRVDTPGGEVVGEAVDVRFPGELVVETADGIETVSAGDCEHLWPAD